MSVPYNETILQAVLAELQKIDQATGFNFTAKEVRRFDVRERLPTQPLGLSLSARPHFLLSYGGQSKRVVGLTHHVSLRFQVQGLLPALEECPELTSDELVALIEEDIYVALAAACDPEQDAPLPYATLEETDSVPVHDEDEAGVYDGVRVRVVVHYKHDFKNRATVI